MRSVKLALLSTLFVLSGCEQSGQSEDFAVILSELQSISDKVDDSRNRLDELEGRVSRYQNDVSALVMSESGISFTPDNVRSVSSSYDTSTLPFAGSQSATIGIVEFTDYQCPYCKQHHETTYSDLMLNFINDGIVRYFVSDFPLPSHFTARPAAIAANCARKQGEYWRFHDTLFEYSPGFTEETFFEIASTLNLDVSLYKNCIEDDSNEQYLETQLLNAKSIGITGTPTFIVGKVDDSGIIRNGLLLKGFKSLAEFTSVIKRIQIDSFR